MGNAVVKQTSSWAPRSHDSRLVLPAGWLISRFSLPQASQCISAGLRLDEGTDELTLTERRRFTLLPRFDEVLQENAKLVTVSFHRELSGDKTLDIVFFLERTSNKRHSPTSLEGNLSGAQQQMDSPPVGHQRLLEEENPEVDSYPETSTRPVDHR